ncbi:hypothetical protein RFI_13198, partial [Reticulomyxa filosa]
MAEKKVNKLVNLKKKGEGVIKCKIENMSSIFPNEFRFIKVQSDAENFANFRGIEVLTSFANQTWQEKNKSSSESEGTSQSQGKQKSINPVYCANSVPGHIVISFHDGKQFVMFDRVPESLQLEKSEQIKLDKFVLNQVNDFFPDLLAVRSSNAFIILLIFLNPIQSVQHQRPPNKSATGISRKLQLLAAYSDGCMVLWNWNRLKFTWEYHLRLVLPTPLTTVGMSNVMSSMSEMELLSMNVGSGMGGAGSTTGIGKEWMSDDLARKSGSIGAAAGNQRTSIATSSSQQQSNERPGVLAFCGFLQHSEMVIKLSSNPESDPRVYATNTEKTTKTDKNIEEFENILYENQYLMCDESEMNQAIGQSSDGRKTDGSFYVLMIDYMLGDLSAVKTSPFHRMHRQLLKRKFPGVLKYENLTTRFVISRVKLEMDYQSMQNPNLLIGAEDITIDHSDRSKFVDFQTLMDGVEEISYWNDYFDSKDKEKYAGMETEGKQESINPRAKRSMVVVENVWTTRFGFVIEMTVRRMDTSDASTVESADTKEEGLESDIDLSLVSVEKRLIYYMNPQSNHLTRVPFPSKHNSGSKNSRNECLRFVIGQHGTTKQMLLLDRCNDYFYILDENLLPPDALSSGQKYQQRLNNSSKTSTDIMFDLPFGHFADNTGKAKWFFFFFFFCCLCLY